MALPILAFDVAHDGHDALANEGSLPHCRPPLQSTDTDARTINPNADRRRRKNPGHRARHVDRPREGQTADVPVRNAVQRAEVLGLEIAAVHQPVVAAAGLGEHPRLGHVPW